MEEEWRDIEGYEGLYQVSNLGRVKSLKRKYRQEERFLKAKINSSGYLFVVLCKNGKEKHFSIHRLVAETFIPNPENLPCVNHKSENKTENNFENLEWVSYSYNINYGSRNERVRKSMTNNSKISIKIRCDDLKTKEITFYPSYNEASRDLNIPVCSIWRSINISKTPYKNKYKFTIS